MELEPYIIFVISTVVGMAWGQTCTINECSEESLPKPMGSGLSGYTPGGTGCYDDGTLVTYICTGSLLGPPTSQCSAGIWFPPVGPTCEAASGCFRPQLPPNGNVTEYKDEYALYDRITFYCDDGYSIIGPQEVVCDSGGIWDPSNIPTCEASCTAPSIQNGGPNGTYVNGEVITYTCDVNYTLIGVSSATCRDELWDPTNVPECLEQCLPPIVANSNFDTQQDLFDHGSSVIIDCDPGYSTGSSTSTTVNCNDGSLSMESPRCYENCSPLDTFLNGQVTGDTSPFYHTETVSFSCDTGFTLDGATSITCSDGAWDAPQPMCMDQCPVIVPEAYSAFYGSAPPFQHGDMVTFTCYSGYEIYNGSITSTCQNGQWSSDPPFCTEQTTTTQAASTMMDSITTKLPSTSMTTLQDTVTPSTSQSSDTSPEAASTDVVLQTDKDLNTSRVYRQVTFNQHDDYTRYNVAVYPNVNRSGIYRRPSNVFRDHYRSCHRNEDLNTRRVYRQFTFNQHEDCTRYNVTVYFPNFPNVNRSGIYRRPSNVESHHD
ncbi:complement receptor type 2 [Strongylocentrotus purpuratus]|uniref:Sushi domain-containing protein n=1 Tax=Strongylocentrotus purpuratus TaxID=7668 RepID=A0A7M7SY16_STRPU|nr:complement receptor type 2 [Strongylocentrotus purpuratus]